MNTVLAALLILFAAAILLSQLINVNRRRMSLSTWVSAFVYGVGQKTINFIAYPFVLLSRHVANVNGGGEGAEGNEGDEEVDTKSTRHISGIRVAVRVVRRRSSRAAEYVPTGALGGLAD